MTDILRETLAPDSEPAANDLALVEAEQALFPEGEHRHSYLKAATGLGIVAVSAVAANRLGLPLGHLLDAQFIPKVPVQEGIVGGMVEVNDGLREVAPYVASAGVAKLLYDKVRGESSDTNKLRNKLAQSDYSGPESVTAHNLAVRQSRFRAIRERFDGVLLPSRRFVAGIGVAAFATGLVGATSGVEHEVSNGNVRPIARTFDVLSNNAAGERDILLQSPNLTFMDDSYLHPQDKLMTVASEAAKHGVSVIPFSKNLPNVDNKSSLVISIPDLAFEKAAHATVIAADCKQVPVILDEASGKHTGDKSMINDVPVEVVGIMHDTAQMNRDIALMPLSNYAECVTGTKQNAIFGAIISGPNASSVVQKALAEQGLDNPIVTQQAFEANNIKFWEKNGTPIFLQLIAYIGAFGAFAMGSERRGAMLRNNNELSILHARGIQEKEIRTIESRRALRETAKATLLSLPLMPIVAGVFNAAELGLHVGVGVREIAVGATVTLAAKLAGSLRATRRFFKKLNLPEGVK